MNSKRRPATLVARALAPLGCALAATGVAGCGGATAPDTAVRPQPMSSVVTLIAEPTPGGQPFDNRYHFNTTRLTAKAGRIEIRLVNAGTAPHDVRIQSGSHCCFGAGEKDLGGTGQVDPGQTSTAFVTLKPGRYSFLCSFPSHWQDHMQGELIVK